MSSASPLSPEHQEVKRILALCLPRGIPTSPLPAAAGPLDPSVPHAPLRNPKLTAAEFKQAVRNHLRYFPASTHETLAAEFARELQQEGHIYMRRFMPTEYEVKAYPLDCYPGKCVQARTIMMMIMNNLDKAVAQFPHELITYGGNGSVLSNWGQYHLLMKYLCDMDESQTLSMYSGHPMGLFPSAPNAPRVVITNGMMIPNFSTVENYDKMYALGTTMYGQMTAGSYCYIGPQGIVHGTTLTLLNAGRKYLPRPAAAAAEAGTAAANPLTGRVFLSSGNGGMSAAQLKAAVICGCIGVIAEVDRRAIDKRVAQGWAQEVFDDLDKLMARIREARREKHVTSIAFHGNVVSIWERLVEEYQKTGEILVEIGSDQTSCHNPYNGGYYPIGCSFEEAQTMMKEDSAKFKELVHESLRKQIAAINFLSEKTGLKFFDYGNALLYTASVAGADVLDPQDKTKFKYPSYVQEFMGDIFSLGFGPFRWICTSGLESDLLATDKIALEIMSRLHDVEGLHENIKGQFADNILWIKDAHKNRLVVGSQARILYADCEARALIAVEINKAIKDGRIKGPVVLSRDHHDVSGTDSVFRETSNIYDGSQLAADMAIQNVIGDSFRGATWVAIHNGGGVGWGNVINGGFGLTLDGSAEAENRARGMLLFDVSNGIARRSWAGNSNAIVAIQNIMKDHDKLKITMPVAADEALLDKVCSGL